MCWLMKRNTQEPDGWEVVRLGDVADLNPRRPKLSVSDETLVTFLPMNAVADDFSGILARDERPYRDVAKGYTYFEEDDVLFSKITPCLQNGKHTLATGLNGGFGFGTTEFHVVRAGIRVTAQYVFRVLTQAHVIEQCSKSFTGTAGQQRIQSETLKSLRLSIPPLAEQRAIATVLDSIDEAIERTDAVIAATERLRDALLHELLTRGVPGWHSEWKEAPGIGNIPACWDVVRLGDCLSDGPTNGIYKPESEYGEGEWLVRIGDFIPGALTRLSGFERIRVTEVESQRHAVCKGDILINRVNSLSHLGKSVLIPQLGEPALFESNMMRLRMCPDVDPEFIMTVLLSRSSKRYFASRAKKAVQQASINQQDVRLLPLPLPDRREQALIAEASTTLKERITFDSRALMNLKTLKALTADALLTGRIRMPKDLVLQDG